MVLDATARGGLEKIIDHTISNIPRAVQIARTASTNKEFQIKNPDEVALGMAWGEIITSFSERYAAKYHQVPSDEDVKQISDIIIKRTKEIKEAIFKCG